jgi:hypothetical protein
MGILGRRRARKNARVQCRRDGASRAATESSPIPRDEDVDEPAAKARKAAGPGAPNPLNALEGFVPRYEISY